MLTKSINITLILVTLCVVTIAAQRVQITQPAGDVTVSGGSSGGGSSVSVDSVSVTSPNFLSGYAGRFVLTGTNISLLPQQVSSVSASSFTPNFGSTKVHVFTLTNNATLNAPTGVTEDMIGETFRLCFVQGGSGGFVVTPATNYIFGDTITEIVLSTGAGYRDYVPIIVRGTNVFDVVGLSTGFEP